MIQDIALMCWTIFILLPLIYLFIYLYVVAVVSLGYIIRDDWKGDSKISDADRQGKFSRLNQGTERKQKSKNTFN